MKVITFALVFVAYFSSSVRADCEPPHAIHISPKVSVTQAEIDVRYGVYLAACTKAGGDLIDAASATYFDRIGVGARPKMSSVDTYPTDLRRRGISGVVAVAAVVETTGKVSEAMLIGTSGYKDFDNSALYQIRHYKYQQPFTLDGVPVRVFKTYVITFHTG